MPLLSPESARAKTAVFTGEGERTDWETVAGAARNADVVILAEQHGHPIGLSAAAALWRETLKSAGGAGGAGGKGGDDRPALALEFFERDDQSRIDDYLTGLSTEEVFLKRTGKTGTGWDGGYPPGHRDMVEAAKGAHTPVYAANAPRQYVKLARTKGYGALLTLTPEQRRLVALPRFADDAAPPDNRYWRDFLTFMDSTPEKYAAASAEEREKSDSMFRAQSVWDATMADTVRSALAQGSRPVFLVVGQFHADFAQSGGGGTAQALKAARPDTRIIVVSFQSAPPPPPPSSTGTLREQDKGRADFVVYMGSNPLTPPDKDEPATAAPATRPKH